MEIGEAKRLWTFSRSVYDGYAADDIVDCGLLG